MLTIPKDDVLRMLRATRQVERQMRNPRGHRGRWTPRGRAGSGAKLVWFQLKSSLAPGSEATAYALKYDSYSWVIDAKYFTDLFIMGAGVEGETGTRVAGFLTEFEASDVGKTLSIVGGSGFTVADFTVDAVRAITFSDLLIVDAGAKTVSSLTIDFSELHVGLRIHITNPVGSGGHPWAVGAYTITDFVDGYPVLDASPAADGTTGGIGRLTPYATLSDSAGTPGSTGGQAILGTFSVSDEILACHRAYGLDDLMSQCNRLHLTDRTINGTRYTDIDTDDVGGAGLTTGTVIVITDGRDTENLFPGIYWVVIVRDETTSEDIEVLNRVATTAGQEYTDVLGDVSITPGASGVALYDSAQQAHYIITVNELCRIASGVTTEDVVVSDTECALVDIQAMDRGQSPVTNAVVSSHNDIHVVEGTPNQITCEDPAFNDNDAGLVIYLRGIPHCTDGWYAITDVTDGVATVTPNCSITYTDFYISVVGGAIGTPPDDNDEVSSVSASTGSDDVGLVLTITGGTGFTTGDYDVLSNSYDVLTVDVAGSGTGYIGDEGSTGGIGFFSGMTGGTAVTKKPLTIKTNGWSGPAGTTVTILWNESGDNFLIDDDGANDASHEEDYYQIVREYPVPPEDCDTVDYGFTTEDEMAGWTPITECEE